MYTYQVVEHCGYEGEKVVSEWETFSDACRAVREQYSSEEEDELHVAILRDGSSEY